MYIAFDNLVDKFKDDTCIIVGSGPTLFDFDYKNYTGKIFLCGSSILRTENKIKPNFLISCNNHFPVVNMESHCIFLNGFKDLHWILSDTGCHNDIWEFNENYYKKLKIKYSFYDDRHFNRKSCEPIKKCCKFLEKYPDRFTILEIVEKVFGIDYELKKKTSGSVVEQAVMIAMLMGFKKIFIQGVDLPFEYYKGHVSKKYFGTQSDFADQILDEVIQVMRKKYYIYYMKRFEFSPYILSLYNKLKLKFISNYSVFADSKETTMYNFKWISKIAKENNRKIVNLSKESNLNLIEDIKYSSSKEIKFEYPELFSS